jgi:hypothetical protein
MLVPPHYTTGCRRDPTNNIDKTTAAKAFNTWWDALPSNTVTIISDGSEQHADGARTVGYGFAVYQGNQRLFTGKGSVNSQSTSKQRRPLILAHRLGRRANNQRHPLPLP